METTQYYAIVMAGLGLLLLTFLWLSSKFHFYSRAEIQPNLPQFWAPGRLYKRMYIFILKHLVYTLFMERRYWTSITRLQAVFILLYISGNGVCMGIGVQDCLGLMTRSGKIALVNIIPLFFGGRRGFTPGRLGIPLHIYYVAHHLIGRMAILQCLLHAVLAIFSNQPWEFNRRMVSGIAIGTLAILIFLTSIYFVRRWMFEIFLFTHLILAMATISTLIWHILPSSPWSIVSLSAAPALWGLTWMVRFFYSKHVTATLESIPNTLDLKLRVALWHRPNIGPGQYFYVKFSNLNFPLSAQSHPFMLTWLNVNELNFIIQRQNGVTEAIRENTKPRVAITGPYGQDLHLERYENVLLFARGIGISGLLNYIQYLTENKASNSFLTRRLNLYWFLEYNNQIEWVNEYFTELAKHKSLLAIHVYFPEKFARFSWQDRHFQCFYKEPDISSYIEGEASRHGRKVVATCGTADFTTHIRQTVLKAMTNEVIEFAEVEYRPLRPLHPRLQSVCLENLEETSQESVPPRCPRKPYIKSPLSEAHTLF